MDFRIYESFYEILVLVAYELSHYLSMQVQLSRRDSRCSYLEGIETIILARSHHLCPYFVCTSLEGSGNTRENCAQPWLFLTKNTVNWEIFVRILFSQIELRHICHVENSQLGHDLSILVNNRVISPFHEGFIFTKLHIHEVLRK